MGQVDARAKIEAWAGRWLRVAEDRARAERGDVDAIALPGFNRDLLPYWTAARWAAFAKRQERDRRARVKLSTRVRRALATLARAIVWPPPAVGTRSPDQARRLLLSDEARKAARGHVDGLRQLLDADHDRVTQRTPSGVPRHRPRMPRIAELCTVMRNYRLTAHQTAEILQLFIDSHFPEPARRRFYQKYTGALPSSTDARDLIVSRLNAVSTK